MELNKKLRQLREVNKYTQKQVSDYLGIDVSTYAHYEAGRRCPDGKKLRALADFYKLNDDMLGANPPIEIIQSFDKNELDALEEALLDTEWEKGDFYGNRKKYQYLRECAEPVLKSWEESLELPDIDLPMHGTDTVVMRIRINPRGQNLIDKYLKKCQTYVDNI